MERFWSKVELGETCWEWTGAKTLGYGRFNIEGRAYFAHRLAYEYLIGSIPPKLHLDHLCRNKACVNPHHLEPVSHAENMHRTQSPRCRRGHLFTRYPSGRKVCRTCKAQRRAAARISSEVLNELDVV